jgi:3-deoxy-D-manno-octulosonic-acid transferase
VHGKPPDKVSDGMATPEPKAEPTKAASDGAHPTGVKPAGSGRLARLGGRSLIGYIRHVRRTSGVVYEPADAVARFEQHGPMIMALWHGQFLMLPALCPPTVKVKNMVARHGDGDIIGAVLTGFNMGLIRGAGAGTRKRDRGGARALLAAKSALEQGFTVGMTADVPPGPARVAGLGIVTLARLSGRPVVPVAVASNRYRALDTWSRLTINFPYGKLGVVVGNPIVVPHDADAAALETARRAVEQEMNRVTTRAYAICGGDPASATPPSADPLAPPAAAGARLQIYRGLMRLAEPLAPLVIGWRARSDKEDLTRRHERLGRPVIARPHGRLVWVHAASVGETNAVLPLIDAMRAARPDVRFLLTTGTKTSAGLAASRLGPNDIHQYVPFDGPNFVSLAFSLKATSGRTSFSPPPNRACRWRWSMAACRRAPTSAGTATGPCHGHCLTGLPLCWPKPKSWAAGSAISVPGASKVSAISKSMRRRCRSMLWDLPRSRPRWGGDRA